MIYSTSLYCLEAIHHLHFRNLLQVLANGLKVFGIMNLQQDFCHKDSVIGFNVNLPHIDIHLLGQHAGYLVQHAHVVNAFKMKRGREIQLFVGIPIGRQNVVAVTALQLGRYGTLALVDGNAVVIVKIAQHIIAGDGVATIAHDVLAHCLLVQAKRFLAVYLF